ncbi:hypothetical protein BSKO_11496 [Bryopsis sp. KO-2023]|nr:hypothetical protein BSKO_11496 [Bryopsis sp. KO-2023]
MVAWLLLLACILTGSNAATIEGEVGDNCESGQEFPVRVGPSLFVGCTLYADAAWCTREDGTSELCPELPVEEDVSEKIGEVSPDRDIVTSEGPTVVISEVMVINDDANVVDEDGESADWIELHNPTDEDIDLKGWFLTDNADEPKKWGLPSIEIAAGEFLLIVASGKDKTSDVSAHTNFKLSSGGEYLGIYRPDGSISFAISGEYPRQVPNVSYGLIAYDGTGDVSDWTYSFLDEPTPNEPNAKKRRTGPFIAGVTHSFEGGLLPEGVDLVVSAVVSKNIFAVKSVALIYRIMYGEEQTAIMKSEDGVVYTAIIPASDLSAGDMIRWSIMATDRRRLKTVDPPVVAEEWPQYYGTVVRNPKLESEDVPVMYWFSEHPDKSTSEKGYRSSLFYLGRFYDNVFTRRRGITALPWPKPKIKFDFKGTVFKMKKGVKDVEEFNLQSFWDEPGEDSYMREPLAFEVMREAGVPGSEAFHVRVNMNGDYYGLFAIIEQVDDTFLTKHGFSPSGPLFKSSHGELSNLRWDVKLGDLKWAYRKANRPGVDDSPAMFNLIQSLGGGGALSRSDFIYEYLNLPEIINYMAVSSLLLNQDRCTKNFYTYMDPVTQRWSVFPWDLEASMGISNGLNGKPAKDYCILVCEQWNSPLYCDAEHPQDLQDLLGLKIQTGRRLSQLPQRPITYELPDPDVYNEDRTKTGSAIGPAGTYNHLDDAILSWGPTREMYLRRLRTLVDTYLNGRLVEIMDEMWDTIKGEAAIDNKEWGVLKGNVNRGYKQLLTEQLPKRKAQLLEEYGPEGAGLVPEAQKTKFRMKIVAIDEDYVEIENPNKFATDISGWKLSGDVEFFFEPGTVVPSKTSIFVVPDIVAFRNRKKSPKGGEGLFSVGPSTPVNGASMALLTSQGKTVTQT